MPTVEENTRTFPKIWETLSPGERAELRYQLLRRGASRWSIFRWTHGGSPKKVTMRKRVARELNRMGYNTNSVNLFPMRHDK